MDEEIRCEGRERKSVGKRRGRQLGSCYEVEGKQVPGVGVDVTGESGELEASSNGAPGSLAWRGSWVTT